MGQKVNPISNRLGIIRGWDSNWFGGSNFGDRILEDSKLRKYLDARLAKASVSRIVIERTPKLITITVCTARPGIIIGKGGQEVDSSRKNLRKSQIRTYRLTSSKCASRISMQTSLAKASLARLKVK